MTDVLTAKQRSLCMSRIRSTNTKPEIRVRSLLHRMGYRFRIHRADLPGKPDIVFPSRKKIIFIHGCFWHQHPDCRYASKPSNRREFWEKKLAGNVARDRQHLTTLSLLGWDCLVLWECELKDEKKLEKLLIKFVTKGHTGCVPQISDII